MTEKNEWLAEQFEANRTHLLRGGLPNPRLAERGGRRCSGGLAQPQPLRHQRYREPRRMADDGRRAGVPRHAALAQIATGGAPGRARPRADREPPGRDRPGARGDTGRLARARAARGFLETLAPAERVAFVLRDLFAVPFQEIALIVGRSSSGAHRPLLGSSRAARGAERRVRPRFPTPILPASGQLSTHSWLPRAAETSRRCSRCLTQTSCRGPTP